MLQFHNVTLTERHKLLHDDITGRSTYMASEILAVGRKYLVLQYSVAIIAYSQQVLGMKDLFRT